MENYICLGCKFKFKASRTPNACPYCDKRTVQMEQNASNIVDEVQDLLEE